MLDQTSQHSPSERVGAITEILARGVLRLLKQRRRLASPDGPATATDSNTTGLELSPEIRLTVPTG